MNVKQRDVVLLPVPFSNQAARKVRPAIVVSNDYLNAQSDDVLLIPLTSVLKEEPFSLLITNVSMSEGTILVSSRARPDKIFTADKSLILRKIGMIKSEVLASLKQHLIKAI